MPPFYLHLPNTDDIRSAYQYAIYYAVYPCYTPVTRSKANPSDTMTPALHHSNNTKLYVYAYVYVYV